MKNMAIVMLFVALAVSSPVLAQNTGAWIAGTMINRGADILIVRDSNRTQEKINERQATAAETINDRTMDSWDKQTDAQKEVALEESRNRAAVEVYKTKTSGTATVRDGSVAVSINPPAWLKVNRPER